jgi:hypothetical protein
MTSAGIRRVFERLPSSDQVKLLHELFESLAKSMSDDDRKDRQVFRKRRKEETSARPWREVEARLGSSGGRQK